MVKNSPKLIKDKIHIKQKYPSEENINKLNVNKEN